MLIETGSKNRTKRKKVPGILVVTGSELNLAINTKKY
jgi:hypothetical protein